MEEPEEFIPAMKVILAFLFILMMAGAIWYYIEDNGDKLDYQLKQDHIRQRHTEFVTRETCDACRPTGPTGVSGGEKIIIVVDENGEVEVTREEVR